MNSKKYFLFLALFAFGSVVMGSDVTVEHVVPDGLGGTEHKTENLNETLERQQQERDRFYVQFHKNFALHRDTGLGSWDNSVMKDQLNSDSQNLINRHRQELTALQEAGASNVPNYSTTVSDHVKQLVNQTYYPERTTAVEQSATAPFIAPATSASRSTSSGSGGDRHRQQSSSSGAQRDVIQDFDRAHQESLEAQRKLTEAKKRVIQAEQQEEAKRKAALKKIASDAQGTYHDIMNGLGRSLDNTRQVGSDTTDIVRNAIAEAASRVDFALRVDRKGPIDFANVQHLKMIDDEIEAMIKKDSKLRETLEQPAVQKGLKSAKRILAGDPKLKPLVDYMDKQFKDYEFWRKTKLYGGLTLVGIVGILALVEHFILHDKQIDAIKSAF